LKDGVVFSKMTPSLIRILAAVDAFAQAFVVDVVVTSAYRNDTGGHGRGEAVDLRVADWPDDLVAAAHKFLRVRLGEDFTVLYEVTKLPTAAPLREIAFVNPKATATHLHLQLRRDLAGAWPPHV
jgi:hypothetical protein